METPGLEAEVTNLSNLLRSKLFLLADPYFTDLTWELFSLFPSSLHTSRQTIERIYNLDSVIHTANNLDARILNESSQLSALKEEHNKADQLSLQLDSDIDAAADIRDFLSGLILEQGASPLLRTQLARAERIADHIFGLFEGNMQEVDDLAEIIQTKTFRLADLEVQRAKLKHDLCFHAHLLADFNTMETDLKVLVAKIGAYFRFL